MAHKNKKLYQCVKAYVIAAIDTVIKDWEKNSPSDLLTSTPSLGFVFLHSKLEKLSEYKNCLEAINNDKVISSQLHTTIGTHSRSHRFETGQLILALLRHLAIFENNIKFNEQYFEKGYSEFENTFYNSNVCYEAI